MSENLQILSLPFDPEVEHKRFRLKVRGAGAIVAFTGLVRGSTPDLRLSLTHYPKFTEAEILRIAKEAEARWPLIAWYIIHRIGDMSADEPIVFIAVASEHRRAAFEAADFLMDYLKSEAPFWKSEVAQGERVWIEPREQDINDKKRWSA